MENNERHQNILPDEFKFFEKYLTLDIPLIEKKQNITHDDVINFVVNSIVNSVEPLKDTELSNYLYNLYTHINIPIYPTEELAFRYSNPIFYNPPEYNKVTKIIEPTYIENNTYEYQVPRSGDIFHGIVISNDDKSAIESIEFVLNGSMINKFGGDEISNLIINPFLPALPLIAMQYCSFNILIRSNKKINIMIICGNHFSNLRQTIAMDGNITKIYPTKYIKRVNYEYGLGDCLCTFSGICTQRLYTSAKQYSTTKFIDLYQFY